MRHNLLWAITMASISLALATEDIRPAHIASPDHYKLLLENDQVRVLEMVLKPGEADVLHHHHNETVYFQMGGKLKITTGDEVMEAEVSDGHVMWHAAWTHQVSNVGNTTVVAIIVEEKPKRDDL